MCSSKTKVDTPVRKVRCEFAALPLMLFVIIVMVKAGALDVLIGSHTQPSDFARHANSPPSNNEM